MTHSVWPSSNIAIRFGVFFCVLLESGFAQNGVRVTCGARGETKKKRGEGNRGWKV